MDDFKATVYILILAHTLGVTPAAISLQVQAASVRVIATIQMASEAETAKALSSLAHLNNATVASYALGAIVEQVESASAQTLFRSVPSPPPPKSPPLPLPSSPRVASERGQQLYVLTAVGGFVITACCCCVGV